MPTLGLDELDIEYFWDNVDIKSSDDCWPWTAYTTPDGYGQFGRCLLAHRVAYEFMVGPIPEGLEIDHVCHNEALSAGTCEGGPSCPHRRCCNPDHLEAVTKQENERRKYGTTDTHFGSCGHQRAHNTTFRSSNKTGYCAYCQWRRNAKHGNQEFVPTFEGYLAGRIARGF